MHCLSKACFLKDCFEHRNPSGAEECFKVFYFKLELYLLENLPEMPWINSDPSPPMSVLGVQAGTCANVINFKIKYSLKWNS